MDAAAPNAAKRASQRILFSSAKTSAAPARDVQEADAKMAEGDHVSPAASKKVGSAIAA